MNDYYVIRPATVQDASDMDKLNRKTLPENYPIHLWELTLRNNNVSYVATRNKAIIGYCLAIIQSHEHSAEKMGTIVSLAVDEPYRRKGVGEKLLSKSLKSMVMVNVSQITLTVRISNLAAQRLYEKVGFHTFQILPKYYQDGEDAYVMHLKKEDYQRNLRKG